MNREKIVLVFGGTGGIGSSIIKLLSQQGMKVYATYCQNQEKARELEQISESVRFIKCDIRKEEEVKAVVNDLVRLESRIDVLINSVTPPLRLKLFEQLIIEEIKKDIDTILMGGIYVCRQIVALMKERKSGLIIHLLTSIIEEKVPPGRMSSYIIAKSGLLGLAKALSTELASSNIRVVNIFPSYVETPLLNAFPEKFLEIQRTIQPHKRFMQPGEIALIIQDIIKNPFEYPNGKNVFVNVDK